MIVVSNILASSKFAGFKNYSTASATGTIASVSIAAGGFTSIIISLPLNNANAVSTAKIWFSTVEIFQRQMFGYVNTGTISAQYSLEAQSYYSGGNLNVLVLEVNQTGGSITPPAQTITVQARLYKAPF